MWAQLCSRLLPLAHSPIKIRVQFRENFGRSYARARYRSRIALKHSGALRNGSLEYSGALRNRGPTNASRYALATERAVSRYDPALGAWAAVAPMPAARSMHAAAVLGGRLYVLGGRVGGAAGAGPWATGHGTATARKADAFVLLWCYLFLRAAPIKGSAPQGPRSRVARPSRAHRVRPGLMVRKRRHNT